MVNFSISFDLVFEFFDFFELYLDIFTATHQKFSHYSQPNIKKCLRYSFTRITLIKLQNLFIMMMLIIIINEGVIMHLKDLLDSLDLRLELPQHWYSTDISDNFEEGKLIENGDVVVIKTESGEKPKKITIDVNDGMSIVTIQPNGKEIGVKYLNNKDDFEYIGKISDLKN